MDMSIDSAIKEGAQLLFTAGVAESRRESARLIAHALRRDRTFIIAHGDEALDNKDFDTFQKLIARRASGEPLQYITGHQEFFKLIFEVTPDVLIPRPETELIVETALELLKNEPPALFADIGTGSGCIAISLLHELPDGRAIATDISAAALVIAQRNAERHGVGNRVALVESDLFSDLETVGPFQLIASNPPYVSESQLQALPREVRLEPRRALAAGGDGLAMIKRLLAEAPPFLSSGGHLVFEIGFGQHTAIDHFIDTISWDMVGIRNDLQGIPRTVILRKR